MTKEEAKKLLALIKVAYPSSYKDMDKDFAMATVNMWQSTFPNVPYSIMETAFNYFRKNSNFPPTVADMFRELSRLHYQAMERVMYENAKLNEPANNQVKAAAKYIMEHTRGFADGTEKELHIRQTVDRLIGSGEILMLGGESDGRAQDVNQEGNG